MKEKFIIYQMLPRIFGNACTANVPGGGLAENGSGKFKDISAKVLKEIKGLNVNYIWYTGVIRHAVKGDTGVKGGAGSPFAIVDYYDVNPYLADDPEHRMEEFEALVKRTHEAGLKVIIDFVPNHVARDYGMSRDAVRPDDLGDGDDKNVHWSESNDFFYYPGQSLVLPNVNEFRDECQSLENGDFEREYSILPAWMTEQCREKFRNLQPYTRGGHAGLT